MGFDDGGGDDEHDEHDTAALPQWLGSYERLRTAEDIRSERRCIEVGTYLYDGCYRLKKRMENWKIKLLYCPAPQCFSLHDIIRTHVLETMRGRDRRRDRRRHSTALYYTV